MFQPDWVLEFGWDRTLIVTHGKILSFYYSTALILWSSAARNLRQPSRGMDCLYSAFNFLAKTTKTQPVLTSYGQYTDPISKGVKTSKGP